MSLKDFLASEDKVAEEFLKDTEDFLDEQDELAADFQDTAEAFLDGQVDRTQAYISELLKTTKLDGVQLYTTADGSRVTTAVLYFPLED